MSEPGRQVPDPSSGRAARLAIRGLIDRFGLSGDALVPLLTLTQLLIDDPRAPTAVRSESAVLDGHIADSLVALDLEPVRRASCIADLGSGAGFPGAVLAVALPAAAVYLVESSSRKCRFLEDALDRCRIVNARVVNTRIELWTAAREKLDLVTARALGPLDVTAEYAAPLLREGGTLVVWRGRRDPEAEERAVRAAGDLGLEPHSPVVVRPYQASERRHLHLMSKVSPTPKRFPRRPGRAASRPLGLERSDRHRR